MTELAAWIDRQARREASVVRLEDALLANHFARYFFHRLRYLVARTGISTVIHALKVVLLLGVFPRSEFVVIVIAQGSVALAGDFWWGALEQMRSEIRKLQRRQARHQVPREIARWLSLSARLAVAVGLVAVIYAVSRLATGDLAAVDAIVVALLIGAALDLVARTYHSGAYALRRVYRPLPSLLALDVVSVGVLLGLFPFVGIWAFPIAELLSIFVVVAISLWYTSRTYRTLALPSIVPLLRLGLPTPRLRALRQAFGPGVSYALVGLEALVVIAGIATATTAAGSTLVVLLAALAPVTRASFEWARLLYFDLKRIEAPLLADLRRRFDRAVTKLAVVIGVATGLLAGVVAVFVLPSFTPLLIAALVALFVVRSVLAAAQMQAFTRGAYVRLTAAGAVGVAAVVACFALPLAADGRLVAISAALLASLLLLLSLRGGGASDEGVIAFPEWLVRLRTVGRRSPTVTVTRLTFDDRVSGRGSTAEARRAEGWRRRNVAHRLGAALQRRGGAATWVTPQMLWTFAPAGQPAAPGAEQLARASAGLIDSAPDTREWADPQVAARELAEDGLGLWAAGEGEGARVAAEEVSVAPSELPSVALLIADFRRLFPNGIAYDTSSPPPAELVAMPSRLRVEIYRAALLFARGLRRGRGPEGWEVTAIVASGSLRAIFAVDKRERSSVRRAWRHLVRAWTVRAAAGVPVSGARPESESTSAADGTTPTETDAAAREGAML
ncbi:MAG: hypothetical protein WD830_02095 [Chloroflexota bacterium]